jgi:carboxymethylenebutenolidase
MTAMMTTVDITTPDGVCPSYVFRPDGTGPWPAVLVYMDGIGIRPAMLALGERLATAGYYVLLPDLYYRSGPYGPFDESVFDSESRAAFMQKYMGRASQPAVMSDTRAYFAFLERQNDVKPGKIATTGYCFGGLMSLTAAGTYPEKLAASASYHGGRLATDDPNSPHLLAPKMTGRIYVAGAIDDGSFPDAMKARLEEALADASVDHTVETYPAEHGWVFPDLSAYDAAQAEHHWQTLFALLEETIGA